MSKIKLNSQGWEAHTRTLPASQVGRSGRPQRLQVHRAKCISNRDRQKVMAGNSSTHIQAPGLAQATLFNEDTE